MLLLKLRQSRLLHQLTIRSVYIQRVLKAVPQIMATIVVLLQAMVAAQQAIRSLTVKQTTVVKNGKQVTMARAARQMLTMLRSLESVLLRRV